MTNKIYPKTLSHRAQMTAKPMLIDIHKKNLRPILPEHRKLLKKKSGF